MKLDTSATIPKLDSFGLSGTNRHAALLDVGQFSDPAGRSPSRPGATGRVAEQPFDLLLSQLIGSTVPIVVAPAVDTSASTEAPLVDEQTDDGATLFPAPPTADPLLFVVQQPCTPHNGNCGQVEMASRVGWFTTALPLTDAGQPLSGGASATASQTAGGLQTADQSAAPHLEEFSIAEVGSQVNSRPPTEEVGNDLPETPGIEFGAERRIKPFDFDRARMGPDRCVPSQMDSSQLTADEMTYDRSRQLHVVDQPPLPTEETASAPVDRGSHLEVRCHAELEAPASTVDKPGPDHWSVLSDAEGTIPGVRTASGERGSFQQDVLRCGENDEPEGKPSAAARRDVQHSPVDLRHELPIDTSRMEPQPDAAVSAADQLSAGLSHRLDQRSGMDRFEFQMRLDPPELGTVHVQVSVVEDSVSIRLVASDETARRLIESQLTDLRQSLGHWGLSFGQCDVTCGDGQEHEGRYDLEALSPRSQTSVTSIRGTASPPLPRVGRVPNCRLDYLA